MTARKDGHLLKPKKIMYTKSELQSPQMSKKGFYPSRTGFNAMNTGHIPSKMGENRSFKRRDATKDKPGKMYVLGNGRFVTRLQIVGGKKIIHWDKK